MFSMKQQSVPKITDIMFGDEYLFAVERWSKSEKLTCERKILVKIGVKMNYDIRETKF